jgi:rSAM-associated Gly-rich repeat protein
MLPWIGWEIVMAERRQALRNLAKLLPSGVAGLSMSLAAADALATTVQPAKTPDSVKDRLQTIRGDISSALEQYATDGEPFVAVDSATRLAWWGNGGWRNGGWGNGGWRNGGWGNGGWHNWGNGWHNW